MEWNDFIGNGDATGRLKKLLQDKRMPHAILLAGPQGVGKFLAAKMVAAAIFFGTATLYEKAASHQDMIIVRPDGQNIKIEQIRALQTEAQLSPLAAEARVAIIDDADKMTLQAANCLLKTLEEPVGDVLFILVAANRNLLPDTIISRCMAIDFVPVEKDAVAHFLAEKFSYPKEKADALAALSLGSIGRAVQLAENDALEIRNEAASLIDACLISRGSAPPWQAIAEYGEYDRKRLQFIMETQLLLWRDVLVVKHSPNDFLLLNGDMKEKLLLWSGELSAKAAFGAWELAARAVKMLKANGNVLMIIEQFMIKMSEL
jgi:DNA polymerase-3 subunit delta'